MELLAELAEVTVVRDGQTLLSLEHLSIAPGERLALLGPNGAGKSTLLLLLAGRLLPTTGQVDLLSHRLGRVDLRTLRARLGLVSSSLLRQLRPGLTALEVVVCGLDGALEPWWRTYDAAAWEAARSCLADVGLLDRAASPIGILSDGERQQVLVARTLIADPALLLLDEPAAGLDLGARERFLQRFDAVVEARADLGVVLVTHHVEELPTAMTHAALLRGGRLVTSGAIGTVLTADALSDCFGVDLELSERDGRFASRARR